MRTNMEVPANQAKSIPGALADYMHPAVQAKVKELCIGSTSDRDKLSAFVEFVREDIPFGFNKHGLLTKASEVLEEKIGFCNSKTILIAAMCRVAGIPCRVHFGQMNSAILNGLVWGLPSTVAHSYIDVELDGRWRSVDSYIMDRALCKAALRALKKENSRLGFGLALDNTPFSIETCIDGEGYVQMGGLMRDYGAFEDTIEFVNSPYCTPNDLNNKVLGGLMYRLFYRSINRKIDKFRKG